MKGLYPHYVFSYAAFFLYNTARAVVVSLGSLDFQPIRQTLLSLYEQIPNMLFMQSAYYFHDNMNYPLWQLSALVIGGYFVYGMLCHNERLSRQLLFPAAILMTLSLLHGPIALDSNYGPIYIPLLRSFTGLSWGVLVYYFTTTAYYAALKEKKTIFNLATILSLVCIFVYSDHSEIHHITSAVMILGFYDEASWLNKLLNRSVFKNCGKLSLSIYLNHALVCRFTNGWLFPHMESWGLPTGELEQGAIFFVLVTITSVAALWLVNSWLAARKKQPTTAKD